jgi:hypothetical protein
MGMTRWNSEVPKKLGLLTGLVIWIVGLVPGSPVFGKSGSIKVWEEPLSRKIVPDLPPPVGTETLKSVRLAGLRGETVSFQLAFRSETSASGLIPKLRMAKNGSKCLAVHRFLEIYLHVPFKSAKSMSSDGPGWYPDPLVPFTDPYVKGRSVVRSVSLSAGNTRAIWFDVQLGRGCLPGAYHGRLSFSQKGQTILDVPVKVVVLKPSLPTDIPLQRWIELYMNRYLKGEGLQPGSSTFYTMLDRTILLAHQYGIAMNDDGEVGPFIRWDRSNGSVGDINWKLYDKVYGPVLSGKVTGRSPNAWCFPIRPNFAVNNFFGFTIFGKDPSPLDRFDGIPAAAVREFSRAIVRHWKENGWPLDHGFVYVFDEPMHQLYYPDVYRLIGKYGASIKDGSDRRIRFMLTDAPYPWDRRQEGHGKSAMLGNVTLWSPSSLAYIPDLIQKRQQMGDHTWFYQSHPPFTGNSNLNSLGPGFRVWFWIAKKYKVNGVFLWSADMWGTASIASTPGIEHISPYLNARNWTNEMPGNGIIFYPGHQLHFLGYPDIDGPVPSIRMSQWRRGYQDYGYLTLLERKGKRDAARRFISRMVRKALDDGGYYPYWRNPRWMKPGDWERDGAVWHRIRLEMAFTLDPGAQASYGSLP